MITLNNRSFIYIDAAKEFMFKEIDENGYVIFTSKKYKTDEAAQTALSKRVY